MAINLAAKYSPKIVKAFTIGSLVQGKAKAPYSFEGVRTVKVWTPLTVEMTDYDSTKSGDRFGTPTELQDEVQELTVRKNRAFTFTIDKENQTSQMMIKKAGEMLRYQVDKVMIPEFDKYCLQAWATDENVTSVSDGALTKANIVEKMTNAITSFVNNLVPLTGNYYFVGATNFGKVLISPEYLSLEKLGTKALEKGILGEFSGQPVVRTPDSYLPSDVNFMLVHGNSVVAPVKIKTLRILEDVQGIDGAVCEGRMMYDAFVLKTVAKGVYVSKNA